MFFFFFFLLVDEILHDIAVFFRDMLCRWMSVRFIFVFPYVGVSNIRRYLYENVNKTAVMFYNETK